MEETSLDQFVDAGGAADDGEGGGDVGGATDDGDGGGDDVSDLDDSAGTEPDPDTADATRPVNPTGVSPATSTSAWTPGGAACDACGSSVERRWIDDGVLVCADCTDW